MRKILIAALLTVFSFSTVTPAFAQSYEPSVIENKNVNDVKEYTFDDILALEPYVHVEDGLLILDENSASDAGIDNELIQGQQEYFNYLNQQVKTNVISVSQDLTIQDLSEDNNEKQSDSPMLFKATCKPKGKTTSPESFWWGYRTKLNSCDTKKAITDANTVAAGAAISTAGLGGLGAWFPVFLAGGVITGLTSGYFWLFGTRLDANNNGSGVIVDMTWATVYDIEPQ
ncbi:hypothetical protein ACIQ7N_04175 [Lysinibacillus sp. NPDC095746]|uniref:hypothetical protein n=1 Tax=Lysinibacillus sp. NPDC095746 TaxID=3364134 RepID=UPI0038298129